MLLSCLSLGAALLLGSRELSAQVTQVAGVTRVEMVQGRSLPVTGSAVITKVTVANPLIADVVVISETEVVINGILAGETDIIFWGAANTPRRHYRVVVRSSPERRQILLAVKFAEVRRESLREIGTSLRFRAENGSTRVGTGEFRSDAPFVGNDVQLPNSLRYLTVLSSFNTKDLLGLLDAQEQLGNARFLAEPNLMAANREEASFLAGGEIPVPVIQGGGGLSQVNILYKEYGIRLNFVGEVLTDSLLKLKVKPEVSSLDYANALLLQGFRIPALRSRRVESTVDVLDGRSLIISGLFNEDRERVRTGLPFLSNIPILGDLFSSTRWINNESELIVIVTPILMDPNNPRAVDLLRFLPDSTLPAKPALKKRLPPESPR